MAELTSHDHETLKGYMMKKAFVLKNLPHKTAVQKVYVGTSNLYALQKSGDSLYISRFSMDRPFDEKAQTPTYQGQMSLLHFGHGQTLDYFSHNGTGYFLVATKPNTDGWATQIGRIEYQDGATIDSNLEVTRISSINHAQKSGASIGTLLRTEAAVSTSGKEILILAMNQAKTKSVLTRYNLEQLNNVLDNNEGKNIAASDPAVKATAIATMTISGNLSLSHTMNNSVQGLDLSDGAAIYMSSGNEGEQPTISKSLWSSGTINKGHKVDSRYWPISKGLVETEGIQLKGNYLFLGVAYHSQPAGVPYPENQTTDNLVYYIDKTKF
ncbi:helveticin J family class III bacteriocin [Levilactobacillus sp. HBUAS70063]|uniref:helveticin J family class III bacteriocin n=1 Tax=Levilactobacillus sp. HBUAS70063 TaxID=3109359 RepID=UPI003132AD46